MKWFVIAACFGLISCASNFYHTKIDSGAFYTTIDRCYYGNTLEEERYQTARPAEFIQNKPCYPDPVQAGCTHGLICHTIKGPVKIYN